MPEEIPKNIETPVPQEADIDRVAGEVLKQKEAPEAKGVSGAELVKKALENMAPPAATPASAPAAPAPNIPDYAQNAAPAAKMEIEHLVDMALREGITKAQSEAAKSNPFVLDAFHDALAGKLYPELQKRKIVD